MSYQFTADWFSQNIPEWSRQLSGLAQRECRLLEIGSYEGRSAVWLADNILNDARSSLVCIDTFDYQYFGKGGEDRFDANIAACPRASQIIKRKNRSFDELRTCDLPFDFAYIDGSHEGRDVMADWVQLFPLIKHGGLVCFDDYEWRDIHHTVHHEPKPAIDCIRELWADKIQVLSIGYQLWVRVVA